MINKFFVYGTLQKGMYNQNFLPEETVISRRDASIKGSLFWVKNGNYPALLLEGDTVVKGEIVEVKDEFLKEVLKRCDNLEGHPCIYERKVVTIEIDGQKEQCYTYIFKQYTMLGAEIPSGNYKEEYNILFKR